MKILVRRDRSKDNLILQWCKKIDSKCAGRILWIVLSILTIIRLGIFVRIPYRAIGDSAFDDRYLLERAADLMNHQWLGAYDMCTLIKGASFPLFVMLTKYLFVTYPMLLGIFYVVASGIFTKALSKVFDNKHFGAFSYLLLLYSPVGFDADITLRLYRNAILFPSIILVLACILFVYFDREQSVKKRLVDLIGLGFAFSFFYYIREDSIWMLPLFIGALCVTLCWYVFVSKWTKKAILSSCILLLIPVVLFVGITTAYKLKNKMVYGVFTTNDRTSGAFAELVGDMIRIDNAEDSDKYWVSRDKMSSIVASCPSLKEHEEVYMRWYDNWADETGNVQGDFYAWAFRMALSELGYYDNASHVENYCGDVVSELNAAVDSGILDYSDKLYLTSQARGIDRHELGGLFVDILGNTWDTLTLSDASALPVYSTGDVEDINFMESITGADVTYPTRYEVSVRGWVIAKDDSAVCVTIQNQDGRVLADRVNTVASEDVAVAYPDYTNSIKSRFDISIEGQFEQSELTMAIVSQLDNKVIESVPLQSVDDDKVLLSIDAYDKIALDDKGTVFANSTVKISSLIMMVMKLMNIVLLIVFTIGVMWLTYVALRSRTWSSCEPVIIIIGLLFSILLLEAGVTVFFYLESGIWLYSAGAVPLMQCGELLVLGYILHYAKDRLSNRKYHDRNCS